MYCFSLSLLEYSFHTLKLSLLDQSFSTFIPQQHKAQLDICCFSIFYNFPDQCPYDLLHFYLPKKLAGNPEATQIL